MKKKIDFYKERNVGEVINATSVFIKTNFNSFVKSVLYIAGPFVLVASLFYSLMQSNMVKITASMRNGSSTGFGFSDIYQYGGLTVLFSFLAMFFVFAVAYEYVTLYVKRYAEEPKVKDVWQAVVKDAWMIIKTFIGMFFVVVVLFIFVGLAMVTFTALGAGLATLAGGLVGVVLGVLVALGVFALMFYITSPIVLIFNIRMQERKGFFDSLGRCYNLITGQRWQTVGLLVICMIILFALTFVFSIPNILVSILNIHSLAEGNYSWIILVANALLMLFSHVLYIVFVVAISFHYYSLLEKKESTGLLKKVDQFGADPNNQSFDEETY